MTIAVFTDSTAYLPPALAEQAGIVVVPLQVIVEDTAYAEGVDLAPEVLAEALRKHARVSTSRPSPMVLLEAYEQVAAAGASGIVSVHLSAELSGTYDAAVLAAPHAPIPVLPVDSTSMGMGLGYAVLSAAAAARAGSSLAEVAQVALDRARAATVLFVVASLDYLRRGGRIGAASAMLGSALAIKPLLALTDGHIEPVEKVRTAARAQARLVELAAHAAYVAGGPVDVAVHHIASDRLESLVSDLRQALGDAMAPGDPMIVELGAVAAAHLGPGTMAVVVSPRVGYPSA